MTREELVAWAKQNGWTQDSYGHLHQGDLRLKLQARSVRLERGYRTSDTQYSKGEKRWLCLRSGYYSKLSIVDGKLAGLTKN